jgi:hypothetical protein
MDSNQLILFESTAKTIWVMKVKHKHFYMLISLEISMFEIFLLLN